MPALIPGTQGSDHHVLYRGDAVAPDLEDLAQIPAATRLDRASAERSADECLHGQDAPAHVRYNWIMALNGAMFGSFAGVPSLSRFTNSKGSATRS